MNALRTASAIVGGVGLILLFIGVYLLQNRLAAFCAKFHHIAIYCLSSDGSPRFFLCFSRIFVPRLKFKHVRQPLIRFPSRTSHAQEAAKPALASASSDPVRDVPSVALDVEFGGCCGG